MSKGWENDPSNPDYQEFRKWGKKLIEKMMKDVKNDKSDVS